jgi:hypothetical protein
MTATPGRTDSSCTRAGPQMRWLLRLCLIVLVCGSALGGITVATAHEGDDHGEQPAGSGSPTAWYGSAIAVVGIGLVMGTVTAERTDRLSRVQALVGASSGLVIAALGITLL